MKKIFIITCLFILPVQYSVAVRLVKQINNCALYENVEFEFQNKPDRINPFTDILLTGIFKHESGKEYHVEGFCDSYDGSVFRLRFLPCLLGKFSYGITWKNKGKEKHFSGKLTVTPSGNHGLVKVDPQYPSHFIREGTGRHYFWNGTTAYWMMGWKDETIIRNAIDRFASLGVNRIRVAINGRQDDGKRWYEPMVKESEQFTFLLNPWPAQNPCSLDHPDFDVTRFNIPYWQKLDRLVEYAQKRDICISLIFYVDGLEHGCDPFNKANMGGDDEKRYYRYAAARYSAFNNVMWDVANEYHLFRNEEWVETMGKFLYSIDPYKHLISVHGHAAFPFREADWVNMILYQSWDECGGYAFMMQCRDAQAATGRILPQINEEYGYEDHYPPWGCGAEATKIPDGRSAENRRQLAWEIYMAGCYQTTGERADDGTGAGKDTGGGWINGRGNESMTMLKSYSIIKQTFEETEYWKLLPHSELVNYGNLCLTEIGRQYIVYSRIQHCRLNLPRNQEYNVLMINARTGEKTDLGTIDSDKANGAWQYPKTLDHDMAFVLKRID